MTNVTDMTTGTVEPLIPNTSYTINVTAVNAIGEGEGSEAIEANTTLQGWWVNANLHCAHTAQVITNCSFLSDKPLLVSMETISSTSLHISTQLPLELDVVEVNCTLTAKEDTSYIYTVQSVNDTRAQLVTNLSPYTTYTATCLVFKGGVDQCYIGNDTTQTNTNSKCYLKARCSVLTVHINASGPLYAATPHSTLLQIHGAHSYSIILIISLTQSHSSLMPTFCILYRLAKCMPLTLIL